MKLPISVCVIARNEEKHIKECIQSAQKWMNEVIVLDTGSTDRTPTIVSEEGGIIKKSEWKNDFAAARNQVITYASQPFILMMDADERLLDLDVSNVLKELHELNLNRKRAGKVEIHNVLDHGIMKTSIVRLFPNDPGFAYTGLIHEQLQHKSSFPETNQTSLKIIHYGYSTTHIDGKDKINRNLELLHKQNQEKPEDAYTLFQLGRTYSVNAEYDQSISFLEMAYRCSSQQNSYHPSIIYSLCKVYLKEKKWRELFNLIEASLITYPLYTDLYYIYGCALVEIRTIDSFDLLPQAFTKCIELGEVDSTIFETESGVGTFLPHYNLGLYYELQMKLDEARYHYKKSSEFGFELAKNRLTQLT